MCGVCTFGSPAWRKACARHWSARINKMFGRFAGRASEAAKQLTDASSQSMLAKGVIKKRDFIDRRILI
jgi:hypothetical protein